MSVEEGVCYTYEAALEKAIEMLTVGNRHTSSQNHIILFTDGLHNCPSPEAVNNGLDFRYPCNDEDRYVRRAMAELSPVITQLTDERIALHVFLASDVVVPHILLRKNGPDGGCIWPDDPAPRMVT